MGCGNDKRKRVKRIMANKKQTAFRLSDDLLQRLKAEAKKQDESMTHIVKTLLTKHLPKL